MFCVGLKNSRTFWSEIEIMKILIAILLFIFAFIWCMDLRTNEPYAIYQVWACFAAYLMLPVMIVEAETRVFIRVS
jgi:hypothetical protein